MINDLLHPPGNQQLNIAMSLSRKSRMSSMSHVLYTNAVYWPNYRVYNGDTPGQLNYGCINRVYYAFANVTADGGVFVSRLDLDSQSCMLTRASSATSGLMPERPVTASRAH